MSSLVTGAECWVAGKITRSGLDTRNSRAPASTTVTSGLTIRAGDVAAIERPRVRTYRYQVRPVRARNFIGGRSADTRPSLRQPVAEWPASQTAKDASPFLGEWLVGQTATRTTRVRV